MIAEDFPPDNHTRYTFGKESAGDIIRKLFEEKEEETDLDEVLEVKRIMGVKSESSPYASPPRPLPLRHIAGCPRVRAAVANFSVAEPPKLTGPGCTNLCC